ncbi:AbfB domain-containing protein [Streptomyces sp. NPDC001530]|uniref:AbfB domain-containing protein n=1 Tax=Streptomyces sp. NPDC001530 TaxID=3364582 RepID=UPI00368CD1B1
MPETTPESGPEHDQPSPSTEMVPWRPRPHGTPYPVQTDFAPEPPAPWEAGPVTDEGRLPGTRRLWLAGGLAVAVLIAAATAIAVQNNDTDASSRNQANETTSDTGILFPPDPSAAATDTTVAPTGKSALSSPQSSPSAAQGSASPNPSGQGSDDRPLPGPSKSASAGKSPSSKPASSRKSIQSVNYPDRYWHVSDGFVRLDPVASGSSTTTRQGASFTVVKGLADSSCYSFTTADGGYLRHRNFFLRADRDDGSGLFEKDATFCPRTSSYSGAVMLESVNYPGRYLRHRNFQLRLDPYDNSQLYRADSAFRVVKGWA